MTHARVVFEVARWEFRRFFKLRQQLISLLLTLAIAAASYGLTKWVRGGRIPSVAVINAPSGFDIPPAVDVRVVRGLHTAMDARREIVARTLDGALMFESPDRVTLLVRGSPAWVAPLHEALTARRRQERIEAAGDAARLLARLVEPIELRVEQVGVRQSTSRANRVAAIIAGALMLMGIWVGLAYMFVGITGEKQSRITEQVVSAISPQGWIDGKIVGLSAVAAATTAGYAASGLVLVAAARLGGLDVPLPGSLGSPAAMVVVALLAMLGFAFWNTFIAAIAALVNDPNSSNRGGFIMLPLVPVALAIAAIDRPDTVAIRVLSLLPPTAPPIVLTRLVVSYVAWWEQAASLVLLAAAVWMMRLAAGRIFRTSLLMYGKEPTWREVWRWLRTS